MKTEEGKKIHIKINKANGDRRNWLSGVYHREIRRYEGDKWRTTAATKEIVEFKL